MALTSETFLTDDGLLPCCEVCSDVPAFRHFGRIVCEACKKFFFRHRNVQIRNFKCQGESFLGIPCQLRRKTKAPCRRCRLERCIEIGMLDNWQQKVSTEAEQRAHLADIVQVKCNDSVEAEFDLCSLVNATTELQPMSQLKIESKTTPVSLSSNTVSVLPASSASFIANHFYHYVTSDDRDNHLALWNAAMTAFSWTVTCILNYFRVLPGIKSFTPEDRFNLVASACSGLTTVAVSNRPINEGYTSFFGMSQDTLSQWLHYYSKPEHRDHLNLVLCFNRFVRSSDTDSTSADFRLMAFQCAAFVYRDTTVVQNTALRDSMRRRIDRALAMYAPQTGTNASETRRKVKNVVDYLHACYEANLRAIAEMAKDFPELHGADDSWSKIYSTERLFSPTLTTSSGYSSSASNHTDSGGITMETEDD